MKRLLSMFVLAVVMLLGVSNASAASFTYAIPNSPAMYNWGASTLTNIPVWANFTRTEGGTINSVSITFTYAVDIPSDVKLKLRAPDLTIFTLVNGAIRSDGLPVTMGSTTTMTLPVAAFVGKSPAGTWSLYLEDLYGGGGGAVTAASIVVDYTPLPNMVYASSTTTQASTAPVGLNVQNRVIIGMEVVTTGVVTPVNVTNFKLGANGTLPANVSSAKVYYTGTTNTFNTTTLFGTSLTAISDTFNVIGTQALATGTNYFWLAYDIPATATSGATVDALCHSVTVADTVRTPTVTDPVGSRTVIAPVGGLITVGTGGIYTTLAKLFSDITYGGLTSNTTISIVSNITETVPAELFAPSVGGNYTITIKPAAGVNATITSSHNFSSMYLSGLTNLTIDGSNTIGGTTRNLTFVNAIPDSANANGLFINQCPNVVVKNINIQNGNSNTGAGIVLSTVAGATVQNIGVTRSLYGIYVQNGSTNINILKNTLGNSVAAEAIGLRAIAFGVGTGYTFSANGFTITDNMIDGINYTGATVNAAQAGIYIAGANSNGQIRRNTIKNLVNTTGLNFGIYVAGTVASTAMNMVIANNTIKTMTNAETTGTSHALLVSNASDVRFLHNTIYLGENTIGFYAIANRITGGCTNLQFRNNIVFNGAPTANNVIHYIDPAQTANPFSQLNNNIYFVKGGSSFSYYNSLFQTSLATWKSAMGGGVNTSDQMSYVKIPTFIASGAPYISGDVIGDPQYLTPVLTDVPTDIDGETRTAATNYAGADIAVPMFQIINDVPATKTVCIGERLILSPDADFLYWMDGVARNATGAVTYQWYKDGAMLPSDPYISIINNTMAMTNLMPSHAGAYFLRVSRFGSTINSTTISLSVQTPIAVSNIQPISACLGSSTVTLSATATGTITGYQWQKEVYPGQFMDIPLATTANYALPLTSAEAVTGNYRIKVIGPGNCGPADVYSNVVPIIVTESLSNVVISTFLDVANLCEGDAITLTAQADGTVTGYVWQQNVNGNWVDINHYENPSAHKKTLVIQNVTPENSGTFRVVVNGSSLCAVSSLASVGVAVTVHPIFKFDQIPSSQTLCEGDAIRLNVIGLGDASAYKWFLDGIALDINKYPTAHSAYLEIDNSTFEMSGAYTAQLTVSDCRGNLRLVNSPAAQIYVMTKTAITKQPKAMDVKLGNTARFQVEAHHKGITPPLYKDKFQWYRFNFATRTSTMLVDNDRLSGSQSSVLAIREVANTDITLNGDYYYVVVTGQCSFATSAPAYLNEAVNETLTILADPMDETVCEGETVELHVVAEASMTTAMLTYQWYKDGVALANGTDIAGVKKSTLTLTNVNPMSYGSYTAEVKWDAEMLTVTSMAGMLTVNPMPVITVEPVSPQNLTVGKTLDIFVTATDAKTYQWYKDGVMLAGETNMGLTIANVQLTDAGMYSVEVTNDCGAVMSQDVELNVTTGSITSVNDYADGMRLFASTPNPTRDMAVIRFDMNATDNVRLSLIDESGREVAVMFDGIAQNGENRIEFSTANAQLSSGTYFVSMIARGVRLTTKLMIVK